MQRWFLKAAFVASGLAMFWAVADSAWAQPGGGRGSRGGRGMSGFGPPSAMRLITVEEIETELKLTDDQKKKISEINGDFEDSLREAFGGGGGREKMQQLMEDASTKLAEVLDDAQEKRLMGIVIQVNGANATMDPAVAKELKITDEQKSKLGDVRRNTRDQFMEIRDLPEDKRREAMDDLRKEIDGKLMEVLTDEQKTQLESLKGEAVEIDMSQFRGGPGREGRGERRGRPGREGRDRNKDTEKQSGDN